MSFTIREIRITGFKSYYNETVLSRLDPIFNSITGTNGSGKSNILDGICFVLGLSNLSIIRVNKLEDLMYKGKEGEADFAEVKLILKPKPDKPNGLGFETLRSVSVSRQIFLGGKNRYFLNGRNAQPTKILNFFYSLNININNPHFLVRQGHILKVIQMNPKELLDLVENSLGTKLYEVKRKSALEMMIRKQEKLKEVNSLLINSIKPQINLIKKSNLSFRVYESHLESSKTAENLETRFKARFPVTKTKHFKTKRKFFYRNFGCTKIFQDFQFRIKKIFILDLITKHLINFKKTRKKLLGNSNISEKIFSAFFFFLYVIKKKFQILKKQTKTIESFQEKKVQIEKILFFKINPKGEHLLYKKKIRSKNFLEKNSFLSRQFNFNLDSFEKPLFYIILCIKSIFWELKIRFQNLKILCRFLLKKCETKNFEYFFLLLRKDLTILANGKENFVYKKSLLFFFETNRKRISHVLFLSEPWNSNETYLLWNIREFIKGTITSSIQIKHSQLTTAFEYLGANLSNFLIVLNENQSKKVLEEGNLKKRLFIIPLDKIYFSFQKKNENEELKDFSHFLSFEKSILKAIQFGFGGTKIAQNFQEAKKIAFSNLECHRCISIDGEILDPFGSIVTGKSIEPKIPNLELCSEINNFKQKCLRIGMIVRKAKNQKPISNRKSFLLKKGNKNSFFSGESIGSKNKKWNYNSFFLVQNFLCKDRKILFNLFFHQIKKGISQTEGKFVSLFENFAKFFSKKKEFKSTKKNFYMNHDSGFFKKIKGISFKILKKKKIFLTATKFLKEEVKRFGDNYKLSLQNLLFLITFRFLIGKNNKKFQKLLDLKFKKTLFFPHKIEIKRIFEKKKEFKFQRLKLENFNINLKISFQILSTIFFKPKKKYPVGSKFYLKNSFDFFHLDSIRFAMISSRKYQDLIQKRATVEKDRLIIEDIIQKLDLQKKEILNQNIRKINYSFTEIFKLLIPGWSARLLSIKNKKGSWKGLDFRIYFGKTRKKTLKELSGGQKSILALSLIFSTLISKPVPFYILDEVDAALDICYTENIGKIIKKNLKISQFIIVSLKKGMVGNSNVIFKVKSTLGKSFIKRIEKKQEKKKLNPF